MPQSVRAPVEARSRRLRLAPKGAPYWVPIERGLSVGYYRPAAGSGTWKARVLLGATPVRFGQTTLGHADDHADANGDTILSWPQAQAAARVWATKRTRSGPATVGHACERYLADLKARKGERAERDAAGKIGKHVLPILGDQLLAELNADSLRSWQADLVHGADDEARRKSRDSANRVLAILKAALNLAFHDGLVAEDQAWRRVRAYRGVGEARKVILSPDDLQRLLDACGSDLRPLVAMGACTGARLGELTAARVSAFDMGSATLRVSGKTGSREIHLNDAAAALCRQLADGRRSEDMLFTTRVGGAWTESLHKRPFKEAVKRAGVDRRTTFYALRHAYISHALKTGVPAKAVADHCGTSVRMIEQNYAKFLPEDRARYAAMAAPALDIFGFGDRGAPSER